MYNSVKLEHEHKLEFFYSDINETVYRCIIPGCNFIKPEPEDCGTGA